MSELVQLNATTTSFDASVLLAGFESPAILLSPSYEILACNQAYEVHYGRTVKQGERCFAVSHGYDSPCDENGESCPLRAATRSRRTERVFHIHHHPEGPEHVDVELRPLLSPEGEVLGFIEIIKPIVEASAHAGGSFVGRSHTFRHMLSLLSRGAPTDVPMLLLGESGTGKELAARVIHDRSEQRAGPFVPVECSGLSETLFESELFGHMKGAFTGATADKPGLVEAATDGTLFLDEVGDIPLSLQVKLLRLLESSTYRRVGETTPRTAHFRLVCATHRDLSAMVDAGTFRRDLYFRINTFPVHLPPLRERREDLDLLADAMLSRSGKRLSEAARAALKTRPFPGNVRELKNVLERAVILTDDDTIEAWAIEGAAEPLVPAETTAAATAAPPPVAPSSSSVPDDVRAIEDVVSDYVRWADEHWRGDRKALAERLGISERTLYRRLKAVRAEKS
jgi:two-component system response regulator HydG